MALLSGAAKEIIDEKALIEGVAKEIMPEMEKVLTGVVDRLVAKLGTLTITCTIEVRQREQVDVTRSGA